MQSCFKKFFFCSLSLFKLLIFYLVFNEKLRDILLDSKLENISANTRQMLKEYGQPMSVDAKRKFDAGLINQRVYKRLILSTESNEHYEGH